MNGKDLLEMCYDNSNCDAEETILLVNELLFRLDGAAEIRDELNQALQDFAEKTNRCPCCGKYLNTYTYGDDREYQGFPCTERFVELHCINPDCGNY